MEPFSVSAVFACINSAFKFAEYAVRVAEVGTENEVFVRTIQVVRNDLNETERLLGLKSVQTKLISTPFKLQWIKGAIHSTKSALNEIGRWVERARGEQQAMGSVKFETRVRWVFNDHEKLVNRQAELSTCHQQLSNVLSYLIPLEEAISTTEPPTYNDTICFDDILSPRQRKASAPEQAPTIPTSKGPQYSMITPGPAYAPTKTDFSQYMQSDTAATIPMSSVPPTERSNRSVYTQAAPALPITASTLDSEALSPPCSPPPMYTPAAQTNHARRSDERKTALNGDLNHASTTANAPITHSKTANYYTTNLLNKSIDKKSTEIWAYRYEEPEAMVPELHGETSSLCATNHHGPVNPFELLAEVPPLRKQIVELPSIQSYRDFIDDTQMLEKLAFPAELPANNSGPAPGYPALRATKPTVELPPDVHPRYQAPEETIGISISSIQQSPATQPSKGAMPHFHHEPFALSFAQPTTARIYHGQSGVSSSLPLSIQPVFFGKETRAPSPPSSALSTTSSALVSSKATLDFDRQFASPRMEATIPNAPSTEPRLKRAETTASVRMQSQKAFMDLLGNIDQS